MNTDEDVVLVAHSGGGFIGANAIEGLTSKDRTGKGLKGGISKLVFLTGAIFPEGFTHADLPFQVVEVSY